MNPFANGVMGGSSSITLGMPLIAIHAAEEAFSAANRVRIANGMAPLSLPDELKPENAYKPAVESSNNNNTDNIVNMVVMYGSLAIGGYVVYRIVKKNL